MKLKKLPITYYLLLIVCLSFFAIRPLFHIGFFPVHDDTQVARVAQMAQAIRDGQFPVRWVADLGYGYGYPIFNFYAPLAYYVGAFFSLLGFSALTAAKIMFGMGIILAGVSMYFLAKKFWGQWGGLVAALFYIYLPYHAVQIFVRGSVGELWAYAFLPLVFLGVYRRRVLLTAISLAAVILSHNLTALMLIPFLLLVLLALLIFSKNKKQFLILNSKFLILAVALAAFYWLPALVEMKFTQVFGQLGGGADWRDHFVFIGQLWTSLWGFGGSAPGQLDGMSFVIGKLHLLTMAGSLLAVKRSRQRGIWLVGLALFLLAVFLMVGISQPLWQAIPVMAFIQYPWRFLVFAGLTASFLAGAIAFAFDTPIRIAVTVMLLVLVVVFNQKYFQPQKYISPDYLGDIEWTTSRISDEYLPQDFPAPQSKEEVAWQKVKILSGQTEISNAIFKSHRYQFTANARTDSEILVNTAYFPGWRVWLDGDEIQPEIDAGKIKLVLGPGEHQVKLKFTNTPIRTIANIISLAGLIILIFLAKKKRRGFA